MKISVVGLGKLGTPLAAVMAEAGHTVVGVDRSQAAVASIAAGRAHVAEAGLQPLLDITRERLTATTDLAGAVRRTDATFLVVPTPSEADGSFSLGLVLEAIDSVGVALRSKAGLPHLVVVTSTVMPGSTDGPIRSALEASSGFKVGNEVGLCYSPEFIALGSVIADLKNTDMILIGQSDDQSGEWLERILLSITERRPPVVRTRAINAEIAKLAINTFVTTKISFANMLGELCEQLPGAEASAVTAAVGLDSRIGGKYMKSATPFGGPCFPRDNRALARLAQSVGSSADIAVATQAVNSRQVKRLADLVGQHTPPGGTVAVLGLAYKPGTPVVDESAGVALAHELTVRGYHVSVFDPMGMTNSEAVLGTMVAYAETLEACVAEVDTVIIATAWPDFTAVEHLGLPDRQGGRLVIDCWGLLSDRSSLHVVRPGNGRPHGVVGGGDMGLTDGT